MLAAPHLENLYPLAASLRNDGGFDCGARNDGLAQPNAVAFADDHQDLIEGHFRPHVSGYPFDFQFFAGGDLVLLTAGFYDRVHGETPAGRIGVAASARASRKVLNYIGFCVALSKAVADPGASSHARRLGGRSPIK